MHSAKLGSLQLSVSLVYIFITAFSMLILNYIAFFKLWLLDFFPLKSFIVNFNFVLTFAPSCGDLSVQDQICTKSHNNRLLLHYTEIWGISL